jgi:hypothetical protein
MKNQDYFYGEHVTTIRAGGTIQYGNNTAQNNTTILYTVAANYELLLSHAWITAYCWADAKAFLSVYNAVPAYVYTLVPLSLHSGTSLVGGGNIIPPIVLATGFSVRITSNHANLIADGSMIGYRYAV